jgi:AGZA family xanthine/uracil permease-like MFS transporter
MREGLAHFFELERYGTTFRRELLAGLTTFVTMSYIIAVNPAILRAAGLPQDASITATIVTAISAQP